METIMVKCVEKSLNEMMLKNAIFLCERVCAEFPSEANLQLLAKCYLNNNQAYCAYHILKGTKMALSRYLFAMSCFQMDLLNEAEATLLPSNEPDAEVPNGVAGHYLLGLIYRYTNRKENSVKHFRKALLIDPLFWAAYEELCTLGAAEEAAAVFSKAAVSYVQEYHLGYGYLQTICNDQSASCAGSFVLEDRNLKHLQEHNLRYFSGNGHEAATLAGSTGVPSSKLSLYNTLSPMLAELPDIAPPSVCRNVGPNASVLGGKNWLITAQAPQRKFVPEGKSGKTVFDRVLSESGPRRSPRIAAMRANSNASQVGHGTGYLCSSYLGGGISSASRSNSTSFGSSMISRDQNEGKCEETCDDASSRHTSTSSDGGRFVEHERTSTKLSSLSKSGAVIISGISETLCLLRLLGEGYRLLCMYRCQDALNVYQKLSQKQFNTGWVLSQVGKAYYELVDYMNSDYAFSLAHQICPYILEGMDVYSTVLYHLQEDMKLSHLAQELILVDRLAPQSWCAMGNCYSLQKDHETAIKNFWRAVQLNSRHAYAYTLLGHEYTLLEEYENGVRCYQSALQVDPRHYNAWYGLGMVYLCQEKLEFAQHHFENAFHINPCSSVILCYIGTTLHALKRNEEALEIMEKAILADKKNPLPLYQQAKIWVSLKNFDKALEVLEELKEYAPRESSIYAMMGKVYEQRKMYDKAILHLGIALDLNPNAPDVATIKAAIENLLVHSETDD